MTWPMTHWVTQPMTRSMTHLGWPRRSRARLGARTGPALRGVAQLWLALLAGATFLPAGARAGQRDQIVIVAGGPSHFYGEHEYRAGALLIRDALAEAQGRFEVVVERGWPDDPKAFERAAAIVLSMDGRSGHLALPHLDQLDALMSQGVGLLALHWAVHVPRGEAGAAFQRWIGGYYETDYSTNPKWRARLKLAAGHPLSRGVPEVEIFDEWYFNIRFPDAMGMEDIVPIATAVPSDDDRSRVSSLFPWARPPEAVREASGRRETLVWAVERPDGGRGVGFTGGHSHWNFGDDAFRQLLLNSVIWVAGGEVPEAGVPSRRPSFEDLQANQDESEPFWFDADEVIDTFDLARRSETDGPSHVPLDSFALPGDLEIRVWAESPQLFNPTNIDIDAAGRVWVAESWNYRGWSGEREAGDRIVVLEDTDGDGRADSSHVFVQEPALAAPLGIAVIGNRVIVSMAPHLIQYTDVDGDLRFDPAIDERVHLLSGFGGADSDHALHSIVAGPDGDWYGSFGNDGGEFRDGDGRRFHSKNRTDGPLPPAEPSDDGHRYVGGAAYRMRPDASGFEVIGHNFRNSYEQAITSWGDVFQSDNDDGAASRTTWLMEFASLGYRSPDGTRTWYLDRRPGQTPASAHWRQLDPGVLPAGDVYGAGAPAGMVFNEGRGLGERYRGLLISADSALETLLAYRIEPRGAGFALSRFDLATTNPARSLSGTDTSRGEPMTGIAGYFERLAGESRARGYGPAWFEDFFRKLGVDRAYTAPRNSGPLRFRPSDVAIGTDGALYVADWLDAFVGGNTMSDLQRRGAIYRIAPREPAGAAPSTVLAPRYDLGTLEGAADTLRSPAVNVRAQGFEVLRARGAEALPIVTELLGDADEFVRARAVWLLPWLGEAGVAHARSLIGDPEPRMRVLALRALRRAGQQTGADALALARDPDPAPRREAALGMRDIDWPEAREVLLEVARRLDGNDPWAVEALGIGASGKQAALYAALEHDFAGFPELWTPAFERIVWRLHPPASIAALRARALDRSAATSSRALAVDALAFIAAAPAAEALQRVAAEPDEDLAKQAAWWLDRNAEVDWHEFDTSHRLARQYDPQLFVDFRALADEQRQAQSELPAADDILALPADATRGRELFASGRAPCSACHRVAGVGGEIGPDLTSVHQRLERAGIVARMLRPTSELMPPAAALGLTAQDVADLSEYLSQPQPQRRAAGGAATPGER